MPRLPSKVSWAECVGDSARSSARRYCERPASSKGHLHALPETRLESQIFGQPNQTIQSVVTWMRDDLRVKDAGPK